MSCTDARVGFIGFGSMASAICDGLLYKDAVRAENMIACAPHGEMRRVPQSLYKKILKG